MACANAKQCVCHHEITSVFENRAAASCATPSQRRPCRVTVPDPSYAYRRRSKLREMRSCFALAVLFLVLAGCDGDGTQLVVDLRLPEGSHLDATNEQARALERALLEHPQVVSVATYVGRSTPKFYYNLNFIPFSPHLALPCLHCAICP